MQKCKESVFNFSMELDTPSELGDGGETVDMVDVLDHTTDPEMLLQEGPPGLYPYLLQVFLLNG